MDFNTRKVVGSLVEGQPWGCGIAQAGWEITSWEVWRGCRPAAKGTLPMQEVKETGKDHTCRCGGWETQPSGETEEIANKSEDKGQRQGSRDHRKRKQSHWTPTTSLVYSPNRGLLWRYQPMSSRFQSSSMGWALLKQICNFQWLFGQDELYRFKTQGIRAEFLLKKNCGPFCKVFIEFVKHNTRFPIHPRHQKAKSQPLDHRGSPLELNFWRFYARKL